MSASALGRLARAIEARPLLLVLALTAVGGLIGLVLRAQAPAKPLSLTPVVEAVLTDPGTPRAGASAPDVVVVVFTDYRCPICRRTDAALEQQLAADPGVQVRFKDWPILGEASLLGARAALAAQYQGGYLAMHRALMREPGPLVPDRLPQIAQAAGLDPARLETDMSIHAAEIERQLNRHRAQAFSLGLRGTPAYLVGPYLVEGGLDERALARKVAAARKAGPPRPAPQD